MKAVSFNVTDVEYKAIRQLVLFDKFKSMSAAFRAALRLLLVNHKVKPGILAEIIQAEKKVRTRRRPVGYLEEKEGNIHGP